MEYARDVEDVVKGFVSDKTIDEAVFVHRGKLNGGGGDFGLGETYYQVCISEPDRVLQRVFDDGRVGTQLLKGDAMDTSPKKTIPKPQPKSGGGSGQSDNENKEEDEEELAYRIAKVTEEIKDKTHRTVVANAIVSSLIQPTPPERFTVVCSLGERLMTPDGLQQAMAEL